MNVKKDCAKMVLEILSAEQKELHKEICSDLLQRTQNRLDLLKSVITCDNTWIFTYDLEAK
jgi:hypothetical protein